MGQKSVKENKNIYQRCREDAGLTREAASERMCTVSASRIEKIESEKSLPHPDEILELAECYHAPELCNHYCSQECPIGRKFVAPVQQKDLANIVLELLSSFNTIDRQRNRLIDIASDGEISADEQPDFDFIRNQLEKIASSVDSLRLWMQKQEN